jgi:hypothetical protein
MATLNGVQGDYITLPNGDVKFVSSSQAEKTIEERLNELNRYDSEADATTAGDDVFIINAGNSDGLPDNSIIVKQ